MGRREEGVAMVLLGCDEDNFLECQGVREF